MKKHIRLIFATIAAFIFIIPVLAREADYTNPNLFCQKEYFDYISWSRIDAYLKEAEDELGFKVMVAVCDISIMSTRDYANSLYDSAANFYDSTAGQKAPGVLLVINNAANAEDYILTNGKARDVITDSRAIRILDSINSDLRRDDYESAIKGFIYSVKNYAEKGKPTGVGMWLVMLVVDVIIVIGLIIHVKTSYKMSPAKGAAGYLDPDSVKYRQKSDTYIRMYVTKVRIQSNSGSGSGRGGGFGGGGSSRGGGGRSR